MLRLSVIFIAAVFLSAFIIPKNYQQKLGVGIDVNWALFNKEIKRYSYKEVKAFKQKGFNTVRIRFNDRTDGRYLSHLKKVAEDVLKAGMIPVLAYGAKKFKKNPQKYYSHALGVWKRISNLFKNYPDKLSFDLIIEPGGKLNRHIGILNKFYKKAVEVIRKTNPERIIFIAPVHCSNPYYLKYLKIPKDRFIMAEWHFYAAGPSKTNKKKLWTDGNSGQKALIAKKIKTACNWQKKHNVYTWVGAWMPGNYNHANNYSIKEQIKFAKFMSCELKRFKIPFAVNADQQFYNYKTQKWREKRLPVLNVLFQKCD